MKLKHGQMCPIHRRRDCCGRSEFTRYERTKQTKWEQVRPGVRRIKDKWADHPDGYRYRLSPGELRKVLDRKIVEQNQLCAICDLPMEDYRDIAPDHRDPKGLGGARRDDRSDNISATHSWCNNEKGSQRLPHDNRPGNRRRVNGTPTIETNSTSQRGIPGSDA